VIKSKRRGFSWPDEFEKNKEPIRNLRTALGTEGHLMTQRQLFIIVAVIAFNRGLIAEKVPTRKTDAPRLEDFFPEHLRLLEMIALGHEKSRYVLRSQEDVFDVVERYAAEGLRLLLGELPGRSRESFSEWVAAEIYLAVKQQTG
jgi:hypothetical protein